jgi:hypothetical protein
LPNAALDCRSENRPSAPVGWSLHGDRRPDDHLRAHGIWRKVLTVSSKTSPTMFATTQRLRINLTDTGDA